MESNIVAVLNVVNASLPIVAELIRSIKAIGAVNGYDITVQVRELEADAAKTIEETERILNGLD
jgi:hypothetical protein